MLSLGYFVVECFYFESHILKFQHNVPTAVLSNICRRKIEITALVVQFGCWIAVFIKLEKEKVRFRPQIKCRVPHILHLFQNSFQIGSWITGEWFAVNVIYIADQPGSFAVS